MMPDVQNTRPKRPAQPCGNCHEADICAVRREAFSKLGVEGWRSDGFTPAAFEAVHALMETAWLTGHAAGWADADQDARPGGTRWATGGTDWAA